MKRTDYSALRRTPFEQLPEHLSVPEYAAVLDCSPGLVYEGIKSGRIPAMRVGEKLLRIHRDELRRARPTTR